MSSAGERTSEVIRHHWDRRAATFDDEAGHGLVSDEQRRAWQQLLAGLLGTPPRRAIDIGCGTGFLALRLAELGHAVTGIDFAERMIERAREKAREAGLEVEFLVGDATATGAEAGSYDLVIARHVIWNLPAPERGMTEWLRVLRPGGTLALIEGKWADNAALEASLDRPASRLLARAVDLAAGLAERAGRSPAKLLSWKYRRLEVQLPFSGGPEIDTLVQFVRDHGFDGVASKPLMDPALWGETPEFQRYLVTGHAPGRVS